MGTLFNQSERNYCRVDREGDVFSFLFYFGKYHKEEDISLDQYIEILKHLEYKRRTDIMIADFDAKDEQLSGFGELLQTFNEEMTAINTHLQEIALTFNEINKQPGK